MNAQTTDLIQRKQHLMARLEAMGAGLPVPQIRRHSTGAQAVLCAFLLIDCSQSMNAHAKLSQAKVGAVGFAEGAFLKGYEIGIIAFGSQAKRITEPLKDIFKLRACIQPLSAGGTTNMADALVLAADQFSTPMQGSAVVVVTDGMPDDIPATMNAAQRLKTIGIDVITIGTEDADQRFLEQIASRKELMVPVSQKQLASGLKIAAKLLPDKSSHSNRHGFYSASDKSSDF